MKGMQARTTGLVITLGLVLAAVALFSTREGGRGYPGPVGAPVATQAPSSEPRAPAPAGVTKQAPEASTGRAKLSVEPRPSVDAAAAPTSAITGIVLDDATSAPIQGARVVASFRLHAEFTNLDLAASRRERDVGETTTDGNGRFSLRVASDRPLALRVESRGYATARENHVFGGDALEVRLIAGTVLEGRVTRAATGEPVPGVRLRAWERETRQELFRIETDAGGNYRVDDLIPGVVRFAVNPDTLAAPAWQTLELRPGQLLRHDVALDDGITIRGSVTDTVTGIPIADAEIGEGWTFRKSVRSDAEGRYALAGFGGEGVYDVHVRARDYGGDQHEFDYEHMPSEDTELDFQLAPGLTATGVVVDPNGAPLAGVYVAGVASMFRDGEQQTDWESTETDAAGRFEVNSLDPELDHQLLLRMEDRGTRVYEFPTDESATDPLELGTFVLGPAATVRGRVVAQGGAPLPGFEVRLIGTNDDIGRLQSEGDGIQNSVWYTQSRESLTDRSGGFHFTDLAPGQYTIGSRVPSRRNDTLIRVGVGEGQLVQGLEIALELGGTITGRVLTPEGEGLAGVRINARLLYVGRGTIASATSGAEGAFTMRGITEPEVELACFPWEYNGAGPEVRLASCAFTRVAAGSEGVLLRLRRETRMTGRVIDAAGRPEAGLYVAAFPNGRQDQLTSDVTDADGRFELELPEDELVDLETGQHRYVAETESYEGTGRETPLRVELLRSDAQDVVLRLQD